MNVHKVTQGECLFTIAKRYGFRHWQYLYDHSDNTELRQQRSNPNHLLPGDRVVIPEKESRSESAQTEALHKFRTSGNLPLLRLMLQDDFGEPISGAAFKLSLGTRVEAGNTAKDGLIEVEVSPLLQDAMLEVWLSGSENEASIVWPIKIGHLDPIDSTSGIQGRLHNLGIECGPVDGLIGPLTRRAIRAFQSEFDLDVDGIAGPITQGKLEQVYGC